MARAVIREQERIEFFNTIKLKSKLNSDDLGKLLGISGRSYRDWSSGNTLPTTDGLNKLSKVFIVNKPSISEIRDDYWSCKKYASLGGRTRVKLYGPPGTAEGRKHGGRISQQCRRENPEYYRSLGCQIPCSFKDPGKSIYLAEFIGVVLGDGALTPEQCQITLHLYDDVLYSEYLMRLIFSLFGYKPSLYRRWKFSGRVIAISGIEFVHLMQKYGLKIGNKVKNQVAIPEWIRGDDRFFTACIRGLYDTDGGTFVNRHTINGKYYENFGLSFTNASIPLRKAFSEYLKNNSISFGAYKSNILISSKSGISRFFRLVQPYNEKHMMRYINFCEINHQ